MKYQDQRRRYLARIIGLVVVVIAIVFWWDNIVMGIVGNFAAILGGLPSKQDESDAGEVCRNIASHYHFTRSTRFSQPGEPPVGCDPGSRSLITIPIMVKIYFVTSKDDQDKIIGELEKLRKAKKMKPIKVRFYAEENWTFSGPLINTPQGPVPASGHRGPEHPIREVTIK